VKPEARGPLLQLFQGPRRTSSQGGSDQGKSRPQTKPCGLHSSEQNRSPRPTSTLRRQVVVNPSWRFLKCSPASCCAFNPGGRLPFRIFWIEMGLRNSVESATEFRNNCPPPSSMLPSMTSEGTVHAMTEYARECSQKVGCLLRELTTVTTSHQGPDLPPILPFYNATITFLPYEIYEIVVPRYSR